ERSLGSWPARTAKTRAQSSAERASGPSLSSEGARDMAPKRETRPNVGRSPVMPQKAEGQTIEPQVSEARAKAASPAATMAAEPDDEPQVQHCSFQGFLAAPVSEAVAKR